MMLASKPFKKHSVLPFIICGLAALFYVYDYFIQVAPSVMTEQLMRAFSMSAAGLGVLSASFFYSYTLLQIPSGLLIDRFGARVILTFAVFISAVGVTLFGITHYFMWAAFTRFLIGLGSSCAFISALFLVARWFSHKYFGLIAGLIQLAGCVGSIFGEAPLAMTINHFGWREVMVVTGLITFCLAAVYWFVIRDGVSPASQTKTVTLSNEWQRLMYLVRQSQVWWVALCGFVSWVPVGVVGALWGVPYLMKVYGWNNVHAGNVCSLFWVGLGIGSPLAGWISNRMARRKQPFIACFAMGVLASLLIVNANYLSPAMAGFALFLLGLSVSAQVLAFSVVKDIVPPNVFASASGMTNMAVVLGGGLTQTLVGFMLVWTWNGAMFNQVPVYTVNNYRVAFIVLILAAVVGLIVTCFKLKETHGVLLHK